MRVGDGRLRVIAGEVVARPEVIDPERFQAECVEAFVASWTARGFASSTIDNDAGVLTRMLDALGRPAWEVTANDVDRVVGALACAGSSVFRTSLCELGLSWSGTCGIPKVGHLR